DQQHSAAATKALSRAVDLNPKNLDARLRLGTLLVSATQYVEAREQAEAVLRGDGRNAGARRLLGQVALHQMQYIAAESEFKQAIDLAPNDPEAYEDLGLAQLLDAEFGAAEKSFQTAVEVKPDDPQTFINLANFYKGQNAPDRAEQVLRQGMGKDLRAVELPIALADFYTEQGRSAYAMKVLQKVEADETNFPDGRRAAAEFYLARGNPVSALERFQALLQKDEQDQAAARKIAECYLQMGRWEDAEHWINQRDSSHRDPDFRLLRARAYLGALRFRDASGELQSLVKDSPDLPEVYYYLAQVYIGQEEPGPAQQAYTEALRAQPGYLPALLGLGNIALQQKDSNAALQDASRVIATSFWLADAHLLAGSAYLQRGDTDQAQRAFELAAGLNPRSPEAQE